MQQGVPDRLPPVPKRLSNALKNRDWHRASWEKVLHDEISAYVGTLREHGVTPERAVVIVKDVAAPVVTKSERFATKVVNWVATAYFKS